MRTAFAPLLIALGCTVACNTIIGFGDLEKTSAASGKSSSSGKGDDDDATSSTSSGKVGSSSGTASSSGASGSTTSSSGGVKPLCDVTKDFGTPVPLTGGVTSTDKFNGNATLTTDELTIVFERSNGSTGKVFQATRAATNQDFGAATAISELAQINKDFRPSLRADGLFLYWAEDVGNGRHQILVASRADKNSPFESPQPFSPTASSGFDSEPYPTVDGTELYFVSDRVGGKFRIHRITAKAGGGWNPPAEVTELRSNDEEFHATLSYDGLTMYFSSGRTGAGGPGGLDIYSATRPDKATAFGNIKVVPAVNNGDDDVPTYVSADHCRLYVTRAGPSGGTILMATRPL